LSGFLLDTNIPSELIRSRPEPRVANWVYAQDEQSLHLSVVSVGERRRGLVILPASKRGTELERWFENDLLPRFHGRILALTHSIANRWGILDGQSQLRGTPLNTADGMIAATSRTSLGLALTFSIPGMSCELVFGCYDGGPMSRLSAISFPHTAKIRLLKLCGWSAGSKAMIALPPTTQSSCGTWSTAKHLTLRRRSLRSRRWPMAYANDVPTKKFVRIEIFALGVATANLSKPCSLCFSLCEIASDPVPFCKQKFLPSAISY
jgi:predicted nucleic acid-binding protein